jgi:hypothetical protein
MTCNHSNYCATKRNIFCIDCGEALTSVPSERAGWHNFGDEPPKNEPFYVAGLLGDTIWCIYRAPAGYGAPPWATHWHRDLLGLPLA